MQLCTYATIYLSTSIVKSELRDKFKIQALHGGVSQFARQNIITQFKRGRIQVLVATDVAARGIDVENVDLIVHTQFPDDFDTYVHRSGRTGRAGRGGTSIVLHSATARDTDRLASFENALTIKFEKIQSSSGERVREAGKIYSAKSAERFAE
ncbi:P-loop containing nucleoside triphosphate hydrolase protein, partial [Ochromonadaceae sp. CCMP2298]